MEAIKNRIMSFFGKKSEAKPYIENYLRLSKSDWKTLKKANGIRASKENIERYKEMKKFRTNGTIKINN